MREGLAKASWRRRQLSTSNACPCRTREHIRSLEFSTLGRGCSSEIRSMDRQLTILRFTVARAAACDAQAYCLGGTYHGGPQEFDGYVVSPEFPTFTLDQSFHHRLYAPGLSAAGILGANARSFDRNGAAAEEGESWSALQITFTDALTHMSSGAS